MVLPLFSLLYSLEILYCLFLHFVIEQVPLFLRILFHPLHAQELFLVFYLIYRGSSRHKCRNRFGSRCTSFCSMRFIFHLCFYQFLSVKLNHQVHGESNYQQKCDRYTNYNQRFGISIVSLRYRSRVFCLI